MGSWGQLADAIIKLWHEIGWWSLGGAAVVALVWKALDAWGKRKRTE